MGSLISSTFNSEVITVGQGRGDMLQGLAKGLEDIHKGEKRRICLSADQAYGFYDLSLLIEVARTELSQGSTLQPGQEVQTRSMRGVSKTFRVVKASESQVTLDGNHPLAGQDLVFDIEATEAREATSQEIAESFTQSTRREFH